MTITHPFSDALVFRQSHDGFDVFIGELCHGHALILTGNVIGQDYGGKDGEAISHVERAVVVVVVDSCELLQK